jgi:glycosyltransferase involved in cell wall biosynthesis
VTPRVSVIVTCYNLGRYLDEAVESVFAQTFQDWELLIVDDGSTDPSTRQLLARYDRPRTRVLGTAENRGLPAARNLGIAHACGEYLCALDADDKLAPTYFEKAVRRLESDPSLTFVSCWLQAFGDEEWVWKRDRCDLVTLLAECTVNGPSLVRRSAVLALGGYDATMREGNEDWDLWISLVERGHRGAVLPEVLFYYRRRPGSLSRTCLVPETHLRIVRYLVDKHHESYRTHLIDVLLRKETEVAELRRRRHALEQEIDARLMPALEHWAAELESGRARPAAPPGPGPGGADTTPADLGDTERARLHEALRQSRAEVDALRRSVSWRITAPLRGLYDALRRVRRRGTAGRIRR